MPKVQFVCCWIALSLCLFGCEDQTYPFYGTFLNVACDAKPSVRCLQVDLGKLNQPDQYRVVMSTTEYSDDAPPYAGATNLVPLSNDYEFVKPIPNAQRDPIILKPNQYNVDVEVTAKKLNPVSPLYFYLLKVSGNSYVPSGLKHITVYAEP